MVTLEITSKNSGAKPTVPKYNKIKISKDFFFTIVFFKKKMRRKNWTKKYYQSSFARPYELYYIYINSKEPTV